MAHNGEVVSYQGTSSLHVARFAKRSEADAAFDALGFHYASVLFKKDSHGWWSVAKTYGLQRTVDSLIAARGRERDLEDASTDDQAAEHVRGSVVARRRKTPQGRQFTILELRFVRRGRSLSRQVVFASVDRFTKALRAFGQTEGDIAKFRGAAAKAAVCCVAPDSDDEAPSLSATATEMLETALAADCAAVEAWLDASQAVEKAVPRLGCGSKGVGTYGGKAKVGAGSLDAATLRKALETGAPEVTVLLVPKARDDDADARNRGRALFRVVIDCPAHSLAVELESQRFQAFVDLDEALRERRARPRDAADGRYDSVEAALAESFAPAPPPFPRRYAKRSFATFGSPLTGHELEDRRSALALYFSELLKRDAGDGGEDARAALVGWLRAMGPQAADDDADDRAAASSPPRGGGAKGLLRAGVGLVSAWASRGRDAAAEPSTAKRAGAAAKKGRSRKGAVPPRIKMAHEMDAPDGDLRLGARSRRRLFGVVDDGDGDEGGRDVDVEFEAFDSEDEAAGVAAVEEAPRSASPPLRIFGRIDDGDADGGDDPPGVAARELPDDDGEAAALLEEMRAALEPQSDEVLMFALAAVENFDGCVAPRRLASPFVVSARVFDDLKEDSWPQTSEPRPADAMAWAPPCQFILPLDAAARAAPDGDADRPETAEDEAEDPPRLSKPRVVFGLHDASRGKGSDPDASLECVCVLDPADYADTSDVRLDLVDDEHARLGATLVGRCHVLSRAIFEASRGRIHFDAVLVYEKKKATQGDLLDALFCSVGVGFACADAGGDDVFCGDFMDGDGPGSVEFCGEFYAEEDDLAKPGDDVVEEALEIEEGELAGAFTRSGGADPNWIRLGACVPDDPRRPRAHAPKPATLDPGYSSFRRFDVLGQVVTQDWHVALDADADAHGWSYAASLSATAWRADAAPGRVYRRQIWHRYSVRPNAKQDVDVDGEA